jgi:hypothetical protein
MFIVQTTDNVWLWIGSKVPECNVEEYKKAAMHQINLL